ncbi:MAG: hypothetical protein DDT26_00873 [Dehalococcoidia bacterium]|nr:hypothetical protein [Chloroflexota bacterium]
MVNSREPQGGIALHTVPASQYVFQCGGQGMTQVKLAGDIRRRHDDNEGLLLRVDPGSKVALLQPELIPFAFNPLRLVCFRYFADHISISMPS